MGRLVGRSCTICRHGEHHAINVALVSREPYRDIARRYGVSKDALKRHSQEHIPSMLVKASRAQEVADADTLLDRVEALTARIEAAVGEVESEHNWDSFWRGVRELRSNLELIGELTKELNRQPQVNMVLIAPEVQEAIIRALMLYPEARLSVSNALEELEAKYGEEYEN